MNQKSKITKALIASFFFIIINNYFCLPIEIEVQNTTSPQNQAELLASEVIFINEPTQNIDYNKTPSGIYEGLQNLYHQNIRVQDLCIELFKYLQHRSQSTISQYLIDCKNIKTCNYLPFRKKQLFVKRSEIAIKLPILYYDMFNSDDTNFLITFCENICNIIFDYLGCQNAQILLSILPQYLKYYFKNQMRKNIVIKISWDPELNNTEAQNTETTSLFSANYTQDVTLDNKHCKINIQAMGALQRVSDPCLYIELVLPSKLERNLW